MLVTSLATAALLSSAVAANKHRAGRFDAHKRVAQRTPDEAAALAKRGDGGTNARMTFYYTDVGLGACGVLHQNDELTVALNSAQYQAYGSDYPSPVCGKSITITYNGQSQQATIQDECPTCSYGELDLSPGLFSLFASESTGVIYADWSYTDSSSGSSDPTSAEPEPTTTSSTEAAWTPTSTSTEAAWTETSSSTEPAWTETPSSTEPAPAASSTSADNYNVNNAVIQESSSYDAPSSTSEEAWTAPTTTSEAWVAATTTSEAWVAPTTTSEAWVAPTTTSEAWVAPTTTPDTWDAPTTTSSSEAAWTEPTPSSAEAWTAPTTTADAWSAAPSAAATASPTLDGQYLCPTPPSFVVLANTTVLYNGTVPLFLNDTAAATANATLFNTTSPYDVADFICYNATLFDIELYAAFSLNATANSTASFASNNATRSFLVTPGANATASAANATFLLGTNISLADAQTTGLLASASLSSNVTSTALFEVAAGAANDNTTIPALYEILDMLAAARSARTAEALEESVIDVILEDEADDLEWCDEEDDE